MATTIRQFNIGLYQEHLEEASFLYAQKLALIDDPEIVWKDINDFEERIEAHIDALVIGGQLALDVCRKQAKEGDFGELHAAIRVYCRQQKAELLADAWWDIEVEDKFRNKAISDALKEECPDTWLPAITKIILGAEQNRIPAAIPIYGHKRINDEASLISTLSKVPTSTLTDVLWSLGRVGQTNASIQAIQPFLKHEDPAVCSQAALSLLRLGDKNITSILLLNSQANISWPIIPLSLGGNPQAVHVLLERLKQNNADADCLIAIGLLGDISAAALLHAYLSNEVLASAAAIGLQLISGANLYEEVFIPDEIDEDELLEEELKVYKEEGKIPLKPDGQPFGENVRRLSQNPHAWKEWFFENKAMFKPNYRFRNGKLYSPNSLLETLESEHTPNKIRQFIIEEFKIRYNADFHIETDMPVKAQEIVLCQIQDWVKQNENKFEAGCWYYSGSKMT